MFFSAKTLCVDLADVLGAGGTRGEPTAGCADFDSADRHVVTNQTSNALSNTGFESA